jgi:hypothetical protein
MGSDPIFVDTVVLGPQRKIPYQEIGGFFFVDFGFSFWNQFARECEYLVSIIREYNNDLKNDDSVKTSSVS